MTSKNPVQPSAPLNDSQEIRDHMVSDVVFVGGSSMSSSREIGLFSRAQQKNASNESVAHTEKEDLIFVIFLFEAVSACVLTTSYSTTVQ